MLPMLTTLPNLRSEEREAVETLEYECRRVCGEIRSRSGPAEPRSGPAEPWITVALATFSYLVPNLAASKEGSAACTMLTAPESVPFICCSKSSIVTVLMLAIGLLGLNW